MTNLKFRFWEKDPKTMHYPCAPEWEELFIDASGRAWMMMNGVLYTPDDRNEIVVMQFTGLLDMNQKEIFQGDILKSTEISEIYAVKSIIDLIKPCSSGHCLFEIMLPVYIAGNIYENPELLEELK